MSCRYCVYCVYLDRVIAFKVYSDVINKVYKNSALIFFYWGPNITTPLGYTINIYINAGLVPECTAFI